ncbi:hypothetical protein [Schlesneria sp. DSM 10557]|uniref:hypothetical protein n=1 Tax=Schlesneria sp. DSM 10557 TaxID=3044399 RepID=UPI0035A0EBAD
MIRASQLSSKIQRRTIPTAPFRVVVDSAIGLTPGVRAILRDASIRLRRRHGLNAFGSRVSDDSPACGPVLLGAILPKVLRQYGIDREVY